MTLKRPLLLAGVLAATLAATGHAATVVTPPVIPDVDGTFFCVVTNVSLRTLILRIEVFDVNGGSSRSFNFTAPPLTTRAGFGRGDDRFCQITFDGGRSSIRASVEVLSSSEAIEALYSVP